MTQKCSVCGKPFEDSEGFHAHMESVHDDFLRANLDKMVVKMVADIEEYGQSIMGVMGDGDHPSFSYTVGLTDSGHPELITFSLPPNVAHSVLNDLARRTRRGTAEPGYHDDILSGFDACIIDLPDGAADEYVTWVRNFFEEHERTGVRQLVWPDKEGRFPWDEGYAINPLAQPVLGTPPEREQYCGGVVND